MVLVVAELFWQQAVVAAAGLAIVTVCACACASAAGSSSVSSSLVYWATTAVVSAGLSRGLLLVLRLLRLTLVQSAKVARDAFSNVCQVASD